MFDFKPNLCGVSGSNYMAFFTFYKSNVWHGDVFTYSSGVFGMGNNNATLAMGGLRYDFTTTQMQWYYDPPGIFLDINTQSSEITVKTSASGINYQLNVSNGEYKYFFI